MTAAHCVPSVLEVAIRGFGSQPCCKIEMQRKQYQMRLVTRINKPSQQYHYRIELTNADDKVSKNRTAANLAGHMVERLRGGQQLR